MKSYRSLLDKILYRYIVVAVIFFISISGIIGYSSWQMICYKAEKTQLEDVTLVRQNLDGIFGRTLRSMKYIAQENEFIRYGLMERNDPTNVMNLMEKLLNVTVAAGNDMYRLAIWKEGADTVITGQNTENLDIFLSEYGMEREELAAMDAFFSENSISGHYVSERVVQPYFLIADRYVFSNNASVYFMALFDIEEIISIYTASDNSYMLLSGDADIRGGEQNESLRGRLLREMQNGVQETAFRLDGSVLAAQRSGILPDFLYVSRRPMEYDNLGILAINIMLSFILIALLLLVAVRDAKKLYAPIDDIKNTLARIRQEDNQKDELEFIQKLTAEIVRENITLAEKLRDQNTLLRHKRLIDFVYGCVPESEEEGIIRELGLSEGCAIAAVVEFAPEGEEADSYTDELYLSLRMQLYLRFRQILEELHGYEIAHLNYTSYLVVSVGNGPGDVELAMKQLLRTAEDEFDAILTIAIGAKEDRVQGLKTSFVSAQYLMEYKYAMRRKSIITTDVLKNPRKINYYYPIEMETNLVRHVINGEREKCRAVIKSIIETNFTRLSLDYKTIVEFKFAIVATMKRCLQYINKTEDEVFDEGNILYLELKQCDDAELLEEKITDLFEQIMDSTESEKSHDSKLMAEKIRDYIYEHYSEDLSLSQISEKFYLSEGYISKIFKREFGINFKACLNSYRVEKAKEIMLREKNVKMNEVAARVGCNSPVTFIRMFKTYTGVSPKTFINNHLD